MKCTVLITYLTLTALSSIIKSSSHGGVFEEEEEIPAVLIHSEKITHLHFYFQDIVSGLNPTSKRVIGSTLYGFGTTFITDDALTEEAELSSKVIGRAKGMSAIASPNDVDLLMVIVFEFTQGKYNGSSISMLGRNHVVDNVREMPIVGGSGLFRFARGYALAHTFLFDVLTGDATVEYNVTVMHF